MHCNGHCSVDLKHGLLIETNSKPLRNWSKLMFALFLVTGMFGPLLTMHMRVKPKEKKSG